MLSAANLRSVVTSSGWGNRTTFVPIRGLAGYKQPAVLYLLERQQAWSTMEYAAFQVIMAVGLGSQPDLRLVELQEIMQQMQLICQLEPSLILAIVSCTLKRDVAQDNPALQWSSQRRRAGHNRSHGSMQVPKTFFAGWLTAAYSLGRLHQLLSACMAPRAAGSRPSARTNARTADSSGNR